MSTEPVRSPPEPTQRDRAQEVVAAFAAFGPRYWKWITAGARAHGMTYPRMRLLRVLQCRGPQIMSVLRDDLEVTARTVTGIVDGLEEEGLVARTPHPSDRRATVITLTGTGRATIEDAYPAHAERAAALFARLDTHDQDRLLAILQRLSTALDDLAAEGGEPSG